ncbi:MAG: sigma-70 family RNA polymerase sigma factor [Candidatus Pseudobacter hemicellulosilyticus]|uniref:Sigma-70 family RNA polymerase sigma factor n=1 Tax=Candidatus Pseudobacter hemicellulosilyticus TaxID=3121375 RepID=A0AAJ6BFJ9_9BACT|nr:MAG: sigma-70 family RNA polymerase sigma factor [Pseudobacter sp.]
MILNGTERVAKDPLHIEEPGNAREDNALLERLAAGDIAAFKALFRRYQPVLQRYLHPFKSVEDPEEIIQDIFLKLWIKRESLRAVRSFEQYLFRMARNRVLDLHKSHKARSRRETAQAANPAITGAAQELEYKEFYRYALQAIARLPERQRQIYELNVFQDLSLDEIAAQLGLSKSVVIKQLYLANRTVRSEMGRYGNFMLMTLLAF